MLEQWWSVGCIPEPRSPREMEGADPNRGASPQRRASVPESTGPWLQTGRSFQPSSLRPQVPRGPGPVRRCPSALVYGGHKEQLGFNLWVWRPAL